MAKITTFLSYDNQAEQAVDLYVSVFKSARIVRKTRYGDAGPGAKGSVMTIEFELEGTRFVALNGGSYFKFADGVSLSVDCTTQKEVDELSERLSSGGGEIGPCGWVKDRFGLAWQIVPTVLPEMLNDPDPRRSSAVMAAMLKMRKLDISALVKAFEQGEAATESRR
jgi:predicted 3-demethylubiquinone-9 3-methyltransferase (glyoxalase superfamily)